MQCTDYLWFFKIKICLHPLEKSLKPYLCYLVGCKGHVITSKFVRHTQAVLYTWFWEFTCPSFWSCWTCCRFLCRSVKFQDFPSDYDWFLIVVLELLFFKNISHRKRLPLQVYRSTIKVAKLGGYLSDRDYSHKKD